MQNVPFVLLGFGGKTTAGDKRTVAWFYPPTPVAKPPDAPGKLLNTDLQAIAGIAASSTDTDLVVARSR